MAASDPTYSGPRHKKRRMSFSDDCGFTSQQLTIVVGADFVGSDTDPEDTPKTFYAHDKILIENSDFFAAALRNNWTESRERIVKLPAESPRSFELFLRFIYRREAIGRLRWRPNTDFADNSHFLVRCWALGEKLICTDFQDAVMDALLVELKYVPATPEDLHQSIYTSTSTPNALSRLMVDIAAREWEPKDVDELVDSTKDGAFLKHLTAKLLTATPEERCKLPPYDFDPDCEYHEHVEKVGMSCYKPTRVDRKD
ncbi:hypothetical protein PRZ48_000806 [Zasmidium cellare]|uniref:BTB domain-containing protein n=1 Tax=Zasmidium cellare TaxID=395010 RepID=A0ABR0EZI8_ZASCE|nr:hypothetical protein PRZ48_000806 [Zasmidium cellare]